MQYQRIALLMACAWTVGVPFGFAQTGPPRENQSIEPALIERFQRQMTGARFVGSYTDLAGEIHEEEYEVKEAKKLDAGDLWLFTARIHYGDTDITLPVPLEVKWAGKTPVISLEKVTLPGLGTFSAHVVVDDSRYAGTWQHDEQGGHLFGELNPIAAEED